MQEQESDDHRGTADDEIAEPAIPATTITIPQAQTCRAQHGKARLSPMAARPSAPHMPHAGCRAFATLVTMPLTAL